MAFEYAAGGAIYGWRLAASLKVLADEVGRLFPQAVCLGTLGDTTHADEGYKSDHNPFVIGPDGLGVVRAIDIGGPIGVQDAIRDHLYSLMVAKDPRVYPFGYLHQDGRVTSWPAGSGWSADPGDEGHVHLSVTQVDGDRPSPAGYVKAIDSTASWFAPSPVVPERVGDKLSYYVYQDPRSALQCAVGDDWAVDMDNPPVAAVWLTQKECLNPQPDPKKLPVVVAVDATHWDQMFRRVSVHAHAGQSLAAAAQLLKVAS